jgi:type I restriction enzyme S subunit
MDWKLVRAADFIDFNPRENVPKGVMAKKVAMEQLQPFTRDIPAYEVAPFNGGSKFRNGDTLMARITPCLENGKTAQVSILDDGEVGFGSTEFIVLRAKSGVSDKDFIYYLAMSPILRDKAIKSMVGSSGRQRVQQSVMNDIEFLAPPLEEQIEIGHTLRVLDDKIANNTAINHHLRPLRSATNSSPDIRRGKRVSRRAARRWFSAQLFAIVCITWLTIPSKSNITLTGGQTNVIAWIFLIGNFACTAPTVPRLIVSCPSGDDKKRYRKSEVIPRKFVSFTQFSVRFALSKEECTLQTMPIVPTIETIKSLADTTYRVIRRWISSFTYSIASFIWTYMALFISRTLMYG